MLMFKDKFRSNFSTGELDAQTCLVWFGDVPKMSIESHLSLAYGAFQNLRNMPQEHIDDFFAAYKHLEGRRHINLSV